MSASLKPGPADDVVFVRQAAGGPLPDLTMVTLLRPVSTDAGVVKAAGSTGVIVGIWGAGEAYEVEFSEPRGALATVEAGALRAA